ncbi:hypothetical protein HID58_057083 [Brassica napus]|uniref:Uncharacterized protein n=1 Tax=Brassica napus TaxID=3708 RepID=A0ABQ8AQ30_BRANA|nr:hypothetical protein HID58_057083 [Brassica napus]
MEFTNFGRCLGMMIATGTLVFTLDTYHPELVPETLNAFSTDMEAGGGGKPDAALVMDWSVEEHYAQLIIKQKEGAADY